MICDHRNHLYWFGCLSVGSVWISVNIVDKDTLCSFLCLQSSSSLGNTSSTTAWPVVARLELPSCSNNISPAARLRLSRRNTVSGFRHVVSYPRRVQATCRRDILRNTPPKNGLRKPKGARKKRGAIPCVAASIIFCVLEISFSNKFGLPNAKNVWWR